MWEESHKRTPLVGFLSMGSDPTENIERLAKQKGFSKCESHLFFNFGHLFLTQPVAHYILIFKGILIQIQILL